MYCFYDLETTGTNHCFDQILQFAAITTDEHFTETGRESFFVRLREDVFPAPGAVLTTRISPRRYHEGRSEYAALSAIHQLVNRRGTISTGYNSLSFDDLFLRFGFYRNLLSPYTHQRANGCGRLDLYPVTALFAIYKPEALEWPVVDGKIRLKLELLSERNQLATGQAHDAETDVAALIALTKKLAAHPEAFAYALGFFRKTEDEHRFLRLPVVEIGGRSCREAILISPRLGSDRQFQVPVVHVGEDRFGRQVWLELDGNPEAEGDESGFRKRLHRKKPGEPPFLLPPSKQRLGAERLEQARVTKRLWQRQTGLWETLERSLTAPEMPQSGLLDPDAALYEKGFFTRPEEAFCRKFHETGPSAQGLLLDNCPSERVRVLTERVLWRNVPDLYPGLLEASRRQRRQGILTVDERGEPPRTLADVLREVTEIRETRAVTAAEDRLLTELTDYLAERRKALNPPQQMALW